MAFKILGRSGKDLVTAGSSLDNLSAEARRITNVAAPVDPTDVSTKDYVDTALANIDVNEVFDGAFRIKNTADPTKELAFDASAIAPATTRTIIMPNANVDLGLVLTAVQQDQLGVANGVATLNAMGKLTASQVPAIAITETFVVADIAARDALVIGSADGEVQIGDVSVVLDATGDMNVDSGPASYIYTGAAWQQLLTPTSPVQSVNGQTGVVVLDSDDIAEGAVNFYYTSARFDADFATKDTDDLAEGVTNLYFTQTRFDNAFGAKTTDELAEGVNNLFFTEARVLDTLLTPFVSGPDLEVLGSDTVLDGIEKLQGQATAIRAEAAAAQADADQALIDAADAAAVINSHIAAISGAHAASAISVVPTGNLASNQVQEALEEHQADIDALDGRLDTIEPIVTELEASAGQAFSQGTMGESFAANQVWLVRRAKDGETAGRLYKALADSADNSRVVGYIVVGADALIAGNVVPVYKLGEAVLGSADTPFAGTAGNSVVYLSQTVAGKWTLAPSETAGSWLKEVGFVGSTTIIEFQPGLLIQA